MAAGRPADCHGAPAAMDAVRAEFLEPHFSMPWPRSADLWEQALRFVPLAAASIFLAIVSVWGRMTMQRTWREWVSNHLYDYWLEKDHYIRLRFVPGDHQNSRVSDRRGREDRDDLPIDLTIGLFSSCLTAITFIGVLWSRWRRPGHKLQRPYAQYSRLPCHVGCRRHSILLSAATLLIARHLVNVLEENKRSEAELRSIGTHLPKPAKVPRSRIARRTVARLFARP